MKKKKLLFGLAVATAALFSLAACNNSNNGTAGQSSSVSTPAEESASSSAASQEPAITETYTATYVAIVDGAKDNTFLSKTATSVNGKFAQPTDAEMAKDNYVFQGFYTSATLKKTFDFNEAVSADTTIYAKYHKLSMYDTLAASDKKVFATDFSGTVTSTVDPDLKFESTAFAIKTKSSDNVTFNGNEALLNKDAFIMDLGKNITKSGVYKIYFETMFKSSVAGESFAQINGSTDGTTYARVFEIRTASSKFGYSFNGTNIPTTMDCTAETLYQILVELDTAEGKVSVTVNGTKIVDAVDTNITSVNGLKFQAKSDGSTKKSIGHVAMTFEEKAENPTVTARNDALATINTFLASATYTDLAAETATGAQKAKKALIDAQVKASKAKIEAATTVDAITAAKTEWITFQNADKFVVTVVPYSAASTAVDGGKTFNVAVVSGNTVDLSKTEFAGYVVEGIYTSPALDTEFVSTTQITADTTLAAKVRVSQKVTLKADSLAVTTEDIAIDSELISDAVLTLVNKGIKANVKKDNSTATANDGSNLTFDNAFLPTGDTKTDEKYFALTATEAVKVTVYFTVSNSSFESSDQTKGGELQIDSTQVTTVSGNKDNKIAYAYTFNMTANQTVKLNVSSNRLAIFAISYEK